ncbi:hypothetical protein Hanom_Chr14g01250981 [Helianthus anomalus]
MSIYGTLLLIVDGAVEIPYISDENADEDPDLRDIVKMRIRVYVDAMVVVVVTLVVAVVTLVVAVVFLLILMKEQIVVGSQSFDEHI